TSASSSPRKCTCSRPPRLQASRSSHAIRSIFSATLPSATSFGPSSSIHPMVSSLKRAVECQPDNRKKRSGAMTTRATALGGAIALMLSTNAFAQRNVDAAFTATGESCEEVTWSEEALERYPNIASACQEVMERDGDYYVRFEGE